eukprot:CAMPEP_0170434296 /NCGR_PEP_ID=MMETSP0117_2-20130122/42970_1 /TAXON_ID=400756 /ORGANISM="Durinskia baltica, Strain CSIRO CS-38" /LENGTH=130 /DNA_ID=CAMNT_0010694131 /DNA_START=41 /DNA_END=429 /DNA_ORIENTATION=+
MRERQSPHAGERPPQGVRARLFLFYGAGDSVGAWLTFLQSDKLPEWLDVAIYESPGHGQRKEEEVRRCLAESAREAYDMVADVLKAYAAWSVWTSEGCKLHAIDADHVGIKLHAETMNILSDAIATAIPA